MKKIIFMMALLAGCCFLAEEAVAQSQKAAKLTIMDKRDVQPQAKKKVAKVQTQTTQRPAQKTATLSTVEGPTHSQDRAKVGNLSSVKPAGEFTITKMKTGHNVLHARSVGQKIAPKAKPKN